MTKIITLGLLLVNVLLSAQKVEIKGDNVLLDGKAILKSEKINVTQYSFYTLNGDEILMFKIFDNETPQYHQDDYYVLNFIEEKKKLQSTDFSKVIAGLGMNSKKSMEKLTTWLLKEKVITPEGKVDTNRLDVLIDKYDEKILERTIR